MKYEKVIKYLENRKIELQNKNLKEENIIIFDRQLDEIVEYVNAIDLLKMWDNGGFQTYYLRRIENTIKEVIRKYNNEYEEQKAYRYTVDVEEEQEVLKNIEYEIIKNIEKIF